MFTGRVNGTSEPKTLLSIHINGYLEQSYFLHGECVIAAFLQNQKSPAEGALANHSQDCVVVHAWQPELASTPIVSAGSPKLY